MQKKVSFQLGVIVVAFIALVLLSVPLFRGTGSAKKSPSASGVVVPGPSQKVEPVKTDSPGAAIKIQRIKDDKFYERLSRVAEALPIDRDPFSFAYIGPKGPRDGLELTGILWEGEKPSAIINQSFFKVGDSNDQFSVLKILKDKVVLKDKTGEFELRLKQ